MDLLTEPKRGRIRILPRVGVLFSLFVLLCLLTAVKPKAETVTRIQFGMRVGQTVQLKLKGVNESVIWRVASGETTPRLLHTGIILIRPGFSLLFQGLWRPLLPHLSSLLWL